MNGCLSGQNNTEWETCPPGGSTKAWGSLAYRESYRHFPHPFGKHVRYGWTPRPQKSVHTPKNLTIIQSPNMHWAPSMCRVLGIQRRTNDSVFLPEAHGLVISRKQRIFLLFDKSQTRGLAPIPACPWAIHLHSEGPRYLICKKWTSVLTPKRLLIRDKGKEIA